MTSQSLYTGVWKTAKCNDQHDFICQSPRKGFTNPPEPTTPHTTIDPTFKCPENYVFIDSLCYYFSPYRRHTFEGAEKECSLMRGHLVSFKDYEHEDRVSEEILSFFEDQAYIGLREFPQLGGFHWLDPSFPYGSYTNWDDGQPNSYDPFPTLPPDPTVNPKLPCEGMDNSWFMLPNQIESYCYKFSRFEETWHTSLRQCRDEGSELVSIHNTEQNNILWHILQHLAIKEWFVWMGVNGLNENEEYRWTDGTPMNFVNWKGDDSGEHSSMKSCGEMLIREGGLWQKSHCGIKRRFICKKPQHGSFSFTCSSYYTQRALQSGASRSDLVSVHSIKEMSFLTSRVLPLLNTSLSWIGYQDLIHETNFGWSDESPVDYTNWAGNEPVSGFSKNNDCVGAYTRDPHKIGKWANIKNDTMLNFICKTKAQPSNKSLGQRLKITVEVKKSNLVSVQTLQENSFLTAYLENDSWIGLYFTKENKEVQWTDGSEYIYESFELDEIIKQKREPTPDLVGKCPETHGWVKGPINHCYFFGEKVGLFYTGAEELCAKVGGTLAGIHTRADNDWLKKNANTKHKGHWIGIQRVVLETGVVEEDNFYWADSEPFKGGFHSWVQGYRNKRGTHGEFIPITGKWSLEESKNVRDHFICSAKMSFVMNPVPSIPTSTPPENTNGLSAGGIVAIILGSLIAITAAHKRLFPIKIMHYDIFYSKIPTSIKIISNPL
ncbi:MRC [Lepeophtheirus salmonis]|uniref:MRC n=1 Tax=Lepeophtheirus salmonis TaxID=72036 RepID=A0A7R8D0N6_LEPSM|nr:MRC [Lepeophtheirus salmonis]CAF2986081.1 MRC [Lepeophtheirus salmonis]